MNHSKMSSLFTTTCTNKCFCHSLPSIPLLCFQPAISVMNKMVQLGPNASNENKKKKETKNTGKQEPECL